MNDLWCPRCGGEAKTGSVYPPLCTCGGLWNARRPSDYRVNRDPAQRFVTPVWKDPRESNVWWKREDLSRTGSFKDRGAESLIGLAKRAGASRLVVDSSGSAALAAASAAAREGLPLRVHVPVGTPPRMLGVLGQMGAEVVAEGTR
ncbi:MAG TPA: pyridoxal-phosphate dependent enzyme, partial [Candidatus Eisenbacteria bacterium]|nr:pyridoxal-phosphate dependent enzyme [Candidatus Eisenbacteria bacterium]